MTAVETIQKLQDTALDLFEEHGYDNVTVDQIASAAGVSHMTFFRHFSSVSRGVANCNGLL